MSPGSFLQTATDEELVSLHLGGNEDAFGALLHRYSAPLYRYALRFTGREDDAEDVVQETFIRAFRHLSALDLSRPIKPWLYHICTNLCRNLAKRKKLLLFSELSSVDDDQESLLDSIESFDPQPADSLDRTRAIEDVRSAIARLPQKYRLVIGMYYYEELSYEEIADLLQLPINTVRTHLRRAKAALASSLLAP